MKLYKAFYSQYADDDKLEEKVFEFKAIDNDEARKLFNEKIGYEKINEYSTEIFVIGEQISI